jgi:hypothetical protein
MPAGCPSSSTASVNLGGDLLQAADTATVALLKDMPGYLQRPAGVFGVGGVSSQFRCHSSDGLANIFSNYTCENECKNYRYGARLEAQIVSGNGSVQFRAGPYRAPGLCSGANNGSYYVVNIPVWVYKSTDGFSIRSVNVAPFNKPFSIEVESGDLTSTATSAYWGKVYYDGSYLGNIQLYRR